MESLLADLRYAVRMLVKRPAFTLVAVLSLALGIGANTTIFSVVNALLLRSLPVADPGRLVAIYARDAQNPAILAAPLSHLNWKDYREQARSFGGILGYDWAPMSFAKGGAEATLVVGQLVSENYFDLLGIRAARGRTFMGEEATKPGAHPVAVVSHHFWRQQLGGDPGAVGRTITLNGSAFTVIGVAPESFTGTDTGVQPELWVPMAMNRQIKRDPEMNWYEQRRGLFVNTIGRLRPGVSLAAAQAEMTAIARRLEQEYLNDNKGRTVVLVPLPQAAVGPQVRQVVVGASLVLLGVVGLVLLIACANVANLLLARATARRREIAIRLSQGARRGRLVRQLLTESLVLALLGGALGLVLMTWASHALLAFLPTLPFPITLTLDLGADPRVLGFALVVTLATGLLFGLVPALQSSRPQLVAALKSQATTPPARGGMGLRGALVAGQVALSLMALIASGLFLRSLAAAQRIDTGYDSAHLMSVSFDVGLYGLDQGRGEQLLRAAREQVGTLPGVDSMALAAAGPLQGSFMRSVFLEGRESASANGLLVEVDPVDPAFFRTAGVPLVGGRGFTDADRAGAQPVVIVNRTMAEKFWPHESPLGKRFHFHGKPPVVVVGVARDAKYNAVAEDPLPFVYQPLAQAYGTNVTLVAHASRDPLAILPSVLRQLRALAPGMPLVVNGTLAQQIASSLWAPRFAASMLALFGALALVLATMGIYGVMSFSVAQRSRDIGVHMALGARRSVVLNMVLSQGMKLVAAGLLAGILLAYAFSRVAAGLLIGISPTDPVAFLATPPLLALVALASIYLPARKATDVDPTVVLRYD